MHPNLHLLLDKICKGMLRFAVRAVFHCSVITPKIQGMQRYGNLCKESLDMIKILFVCHGNICRSPMAEYVMKDLVKKSGHEDSFYIASAATSTEEIGNHIHHGTRTKMSEVGISTDDRVAVQMKRSDYDNYDYIIGMDHWNYKNILRIIGEDTEGKVSLLLEFAGSSRDIADPWYTGNFDQTYEDILEGCEALLQCLV